jgi:arylformamidase
MSYIDISLGLHAKLPHFPNTPGFNLEWFQRIERGHDCNNSKIEMDVHFGTHIDAPLHFIQGGKTVDQLSPDILIGPAWVADLQSVEAITASYLSTLSLPHKIERLLLHTRNSAKWRNGEIDFDPDFVALTEDAAYWLIERKIRLVGIDYLSVQRYHDHSAVHKILLEAEIVIVEGLNLAEVRPGEYELICLPIKIVGAEGAPSRAFLRDFKKSGR